MHAPSSDRPSATGVWAGRPLVVVCGTAATGKSRLARELAAVSGLPHLSSDVVHKELLGIPPTERAPGGAHTDELSLRTYAELGTHAAAAGGAIVDATFRRGRDRRAFAEAYGSGAPPFFVECRAPAEVLRARAAARLCEPGRTSDATPEIVERQRHEFEPLDEVPAGHHLVVCTDRPLGEIVTEVVAALRH